MTATAGNRQAKPGVGSSEQTAIGLSGRLAAAAERHGDRLAFRDQSNRESWSGRPPLEWTFGVAHSIVDRLAGFFTRLGLAPASPVGVCLPNGSEAWLTSLALDRAGLTACALPAGWAAADVSRAVEATSLQAIVTQGVLAADRPAETVCRLAAEHFSVRFVCAFGPQVPDGVIDLDRVMLVGDTNVDHQPPSDAAAGRVTFSPGKTPPEPIYRPLASVAAAAQNFSAAVGLEAGDHVITLMTPDSHAGLTTGMTAALVGGASLESHGLFESAVLRDAILGSSRPALLIAPGWCEPALAQSGVADRLKTIVLVHRPPIGFEARPLLRRNVVDVLAFGEMALVTRARAKGGQFAPPFDVSRGEDARPGSLRVRLDGDGVIELSGLAADTCAFGRHGPVSREFSEWVSSGCSADLFAGVVIGVS